MKRLSKSAPTPLNRLDTLIASAVGLVGLGIYLRTLAPDILYADSAEFQTLAYTLGMTHSTGYPTYLLLGRLLGFLPISNPAWRINLLSALCAVITLAGLYILGRSFTSSRAGPLLAVLALGISYTFWSQAIIAEVYTPGLVFIVAILLLVFRWAENRDDADRADRGGERALFIAAALAGIGVGVHASVWLVAPPLVVFVLATLHKHRRWSPSLLAASLGAALGVALCLAAFLAFDRNNPPTSFIRTTLSPSGEFWRLAPEDIDSPFERIWLTMNSAQWGPALFPDEEGFFLKEWKAYTNRMMEVEFSFLLLLLAAVGAILLVIQQPARGIFLLGWDLFSLFFILNYRVGDKYVFYLSTYIPLIVALGAGIGILLENISKALREEGERAYSWPAALAIVFTLILICLPRGASRWQALKEGKASFVWDEYAFPISDGLNTPRLKAGITLSGIPENAALVIEWRSLYTTAYLAVVERGRKEMLFYEAMPYGNKGEVAVGLIEELTTLIKEGRSVYADQRYPGLPEHFRILPVGGSLYKLSLRK